MSEPVIYTHADAHRLIALPPDHPDAPARPLRDHLKLIVFQCLYTPGSRCAYEADHDG